MHRFIAVPLTIFSYSNRLAVVKALVFIAEKVAFKGFLELCFLALIYLCGIRHYVHTALYFALRLFPCQPCKVKGSKCQKLCFYLSAGVAFYSDIHLSRLSADDKMHLYVLTLSCEHISKPQFTAVFTASSCEDKFKAHVLIFQACAVAYQCC